MRVLVIFLLLVSNAFADMRSDGKEFISGYSNQFKDENTLNDKLNSPLSGGSAMNTLEQTYRCEANGFRDTDLNVCNANCSVACVQVQFDATISCQSQSEAVKITPVNFLSGGEVQLRVNTDTNLDGSFDRTLTTQNISGVCTNGYVSCDSGTWNNCKFYYFGIRHTCSENGSTYKTRDECKQNCAGSCTSNNANINQYSTTNMALAGTCECINASCGKSFNQVFDRAYAYFGAGISGHLTQEAGLTLGKAKLDPSTLSLTYFGMSTTACSELGTSETVSKAKSGYDTGMIDYTAELTTANADPDSSFSIVSGGVDASEVECNITNTPVLTSNSVTECPTGYTYQLDNNGSGWCLKMVSESIAPWENSTTVTGTFTNESHVSGGSRWDDTGYYFWLGLYDHTGNRICSSLNVTINGSSFYSKSQQVKGATNGMEYTRSPRYTTDGFFNYSATGGGYECGTSGSARIMMRIYHSINPTKSWDTFSVSSNSGCSSVGEDCRITDEWICDQSGGSCVQTVINGITSSLSPDAFCFNKSTPTDNYRICSDGSKVSAIGALNTFQQNSEWFFIKRRYRCEPQGDYDYSDAKAQGDSVGSTLMDNGDGTFGYQYIDNGSVKAGSLDYSEEDGEGCVYSCKIRKYTPLNDTTALPGGTTENDPSRGEEYRVCDAAVDSYTCPLDTATEYIVNDCACQDDFSKAVTTIQVMQEASKSMICSQD